MAFALTLLFMVMVFWRPQDWLVPGLAEWQVLDVIAAAAFLALMLEVHAEQVKIPRMLIPALLLGLFIATLMSHIAHTYWEGLMWTIEETWKFSLFTFLLLCVTNSTNKLRAIAWVFVVMTCIMSAHALMQRDGHGFAGQTPVFVQAIGERPAHVRTRFFGIFEDPNDLAQILATSIPFAFLLFKKRNIVTFGMAAGVVYLLVTAILSTNSRGGMIALITVAAFMLFLYLPSRWIPALMAMMMIAGLVLCPFSGPFLDQSAHDRVIFWGEANWAFRSSLVNMLYGVGYGMVGEFISKSRAVHNAFVLCYSELGILGYWFWFNLMLCGILGCWRTRVAMKSLKSTEHRYLFRYSGLAIAAMMGFATSSYFLTRAYMYPLFFLFALLNAVPLIAERMLPEESRKRLSSTRRELLTWGTVSALGSVAYIYVSILILNKVYYG